MVHFNDFSLFLTVSILINLAPGPDMLYTAARSLAQGAKAGIFSAVGIFAGCLVHISAAVFGLSTIIENSVFLFSIIKYAGAGYLIYLGVKLFFDKRTVNPANDAGIRPSIRKIFFQGMLTNILNPKVALFFLSFLPQFVDPSSGHIKEQIAFLGLWFDVQGMLVLMLVAVLTGLFKKILLKKTAFWQWQQKATGLVLLGLGIKMLLSKK